ncbi:MAG TPA: NADPH:quinone reductase [Tepidisphaeraceae bacterium]|jgi:NADPH2:quinone reductase
MQAIRVHQFGDPSVLKFQEIPTPTPAANQVLIRVRAAGVNPVETYIRTGTYAIKPQLPYTPGNDAAGTIESVGQGVTHLSPGERVYTSGSVTGTYAEFTLCDAIRVHPLPDQVSFAQGAAIGVPYGTAYRAIFQRGNVLPGETVLVHGATGGVGIAAIQMLVSIGARVIGTGGTAEGRMMIEGLGAQLALDHHDATYRETVMSFTGGEGVDVILEMLANVNLGKDLPMLARNGRVCVIGSRGPVEINPRDVMGREADIRGVFYGGAEGKQYTEVHAWIRAALTAGALKPIVDREFPLADAPKAHEQVLAPGSKGKIVLIP